MKKSLFIALVFIVFSADSQAQNIDIKAWEVDINYYQKTLEERHFDLYHTISKEDFAHEIQNLKSRLSELTTFQVIAELMRLTHGIGGGTSDGHTSVPLWDLEVHRYPISLFNFDGELRVVRVPQDQTQLLGKKLKSIDGVDIEEIYARVSNYTPFTENEQSSMVRTATYLLIGELLHALNLTSNIDKAAFVFEDELGNEFPIVLEALVKEERDEMAYKDLSIAHPKITRPDTATLPDLWYTGVNKNKTVYVKFHRYPSDPQIMREFGEEILDFINTHTSNNLIIDLRDNYGGDFYLGLLLPWALNLADSIDWKNGVYLLTDRVTYSAATINATQFRQLLNAKIVGEPTGGNPNGYQDMGQFTLPNSNVLVTYSKRNFKLQEKDTPGLQPDILISPKWEKYKNGLDEVLQWVLNDINKQNGQ